MTSTASFCESCGNLLGPNSQFCDKCGTPVGAVTPSPAGSAVRPSEPVAASAAPPPPAAPYVTPGSMPPPPGYGQHPPGYGQPPVGQSTNGLAIASLVLGIVWVLGIGSILAVIFGFVARKQIRESGGRQGGGGMAIAGIVLGFVGVAGLILWIILAIAVTNSIHDCFNQANNPNNPCGINTNTGNTGNLFNSGSTGNTVGPLDHGGVQPARTAANSATSPGINVSLLR